MCAAAAKLDTPVGREKRAYVREMFTAIAPRYDLLNHLLSLNVDKRWRRLTIDRLGWEEALQGRYLDLCAGTCDLGGKLVKRSGFKGHVVAADFVSPMLARGRQKYPAKGAVATDAAQLRFPDAHFDGCVVGFGVRNLADLDAGLAEIARVLKPGKGVVVLEFSTPSSWVPRQLYAFYFRHVLPLVGCVVSKHMTAYRYLPDSVRQAPQDGVLVDLLERSGFDGVRQQRLTAGIASLYWGIAT